MQNPPAPARSPNAQAPPVPSGSALPAEEPEYLARYLVVKHSWRGRYKRILCLSSSAIITLDPNTLSVTNYYDVTSDFEGAAPVISGRDDGGIEFSLSVRTEGKGKYKAIKFSSRYRTAILTELHRIKGVGRVGAVAEFVVGHLRRRTGEWAPFKLKVTHVGVELYDIRSGDLRWCLDFRDMGSPAIVLLSDIYGKKNGGFVFCSLHGRKTKAFQAASGTTDAALISSLTKTAKSTVGLSLAVDSSQSLTAADYVKLRSKEPTGAEDTPCGGWLVTRIRTAGHGTVNVLLPSFGIGPKGGIGELGDAVSRQLILTKASLIERRPDNYEISAGCHCSAFICSKRFSSLC